MKWPWVWGILCGVVLILALTGCERPEFNEKEYQRHFKECMDLSSNSPDATEECRYYAGAYG